MGPVGFRPRFRVLGLGFRVLGSEVMFLRFGRWFSGLGVSVASCIFEGSVEFQKALYFGFPYHDFSGFHHWFRELQAHKTINLRGRQTRNPSCSTGLG